MSKNHTWELIVTNPTLKKTLTWKNVVEIKIYQTQLGLVNQLQSYMLTISLTSKYKETTSDVDFIDKNLDNHQFMKLNSSAALSENAAAKY